jgi:hypothetical protein
MPRLIKRKIIIPLIWERGRIHRISTVEHCSFLFISASLLWPGLIECGTL